MPPTKGKTKSHYGAIMIQFFVEFIPPTATAQQRRHTRSGISYLPANVRRAQSLLYAEFMPHRPSAPMDGALAVSVEWCFPHPHSASAGMKLRKIPRTTRPDLDNLAKLALDVMTRCGYWRDDSQLVALTMRKFYSPTPGIAVTVEEI